MTPQQILDFLSGAGTLGFAILALWALFTERIVPRSRLDEQRADKKEMAELAKAAIAGLERLSDAVEARNKLDVERQQERREANADTELLPQCSHGANEPVTHAKAMVASRTNWGSSSRSAYTSRSCPIR